MVGEFSSPESAVCADFMRCTFLPHITTVARKRPWSFCQKYRWQVTSKHAYTLDPMRSEWADPATVQAQCGNLSRNELTCNSSGNTQPQLFQLAEPLWTDPGIKSGISAHKLISTHTQKAQVGMELSNTLPKSGQGGKGHYQHHHHYLYKK